MSRKLPTTAVVHEWFDKLAGSERVVEQILGVYPHADLFAVCDFMSPENREFLANRKIQTSFIQRLPFARSRFRNYLPLMPLAIEQLDLRPYEVVISSNHAVAKGVLTGPDQLHLCYIHTPIRYAWDLAQSYLEGSGLASGLKSAVVRLILHYLRLWDQAAAARVDVFIANSRYVARRIRKYYRREAEVIYPPVDVEAFPLQTNKDDYYLAACRLVPYKRMDLVVSAFARMPQRKLVVIGEGPDLPLIRKIAPPNVQVLGYQPRAELVRHMQCARALVFAAEEDFGILPVEAQACGTPVIALGKGGSLETVLDGETGVFFPEQTCESIEEAVACFEKSVEQFEPHRIRAHAEQFRVERFRQEFRESSKRHYDQFFSGLTKDSSYAVNGSSMSPRTNPIAR